MIETLSPLLASFPGPIRPARHSPTGCPARSAERAALPPPRNAAPTSVSTATLVPTRSPNAAETPAAAPVAVLTIFEGQAVFRVVESDVPELPKGMLFRLRKGLRAVTGGTR